MGDANPTISKIALNRKGLKNTPLKRQMARSDLKKQCPPICHLQEKLTNRLKEWKKDTTCKQ